MIIKYFKLFIELSCCDCQAIQEEMGRVRSMYNIKILYTEFWCERQMEILDTDKGIILKWILEK
jgi:hypothetical protein